MKKSRIQNLLSMTAALGVSCLIAGTANADIVIADTYFDIAAAPSASSADLAQTSASSITTVSGDELGDTIAGTNDPIFGDFSRLSGLFNGAVGDGTQATVEADYLRVQNANTITINFDTTTNTLGYDITDITSYFNWNDRADQGFSVDLGFVGGGTGSLLGPGFWGDQNPQNSSQHYGVVDITNGSGGALTNDTFTFGGTTTAGTGVTATGVNSITFTFNNLRNPSVAAEIDVFGVPTAVPEPGSMAVLAMGALGLLGYRRRR